MTLDNLYDLKEDDLKKIIVYDMRKFKKLEEKQEKNFEELKKQEEYENNKDITAKMVSEKNRIQLSIMNTSKLQEELKSKLEMLKDDYERFTRLNKEIEESLGTLYDYKLLKENGQISEAELAQILKDEEELNIKLSANKNELRFLTAEIVNLNKDDMEEILQEESKEEKKEEQNEEIEKEEKTEEVAKEEKTEESKEKETKIEKKDVLEIKEFSMPRYNFDDLMSIYQENMNPILSEEIDINDSIEELQAYIDSYNDEEDDEIELEEKISEKEELEQRKEFISNLIFEMEEIKQSILDIKEKEEELKDLNQKIEEIKKEIEKKIKLLEQKDDLEENEKNEVLDDINKLKENKNKLVKAKNDLIKNINLEGKKIDERFMAKVKSTKDKQNVKTRHNNLNYNNSNNGLYEETNSLNYNQSLSNNSDVNKTQEKENVTSEKVEDERIFKDDQRKNDEVKKQNTNNLPIKSNKDLILQFISNIHNSSDNGKKFLNDNFKAIVSSLSFERNLKNLTKQDKKDLNKSLIKYEKEVCSEMKNIDSSNFDVIMYEVFNDDMDKFREYKDVQKNLFKGLYTSDMSNSTSVNSINDISKLDENSLEFLNKFINTYYSKLERNEIKENDAICESINRLIISPVKLSVIKKYNKDIQNKFLYSISKIKDKFDKKSEFKKNSLENLKNNIAYSECVDISTDERQNKDRLGIKSMVKNEQDIVVTQSNENVKNKQDKEVSR